MKTPIYDFLVGYASSGTMRAHMPGHKGFSPSCEVPEELYRLDITEISGADSLFEAEGIISESEQNMSRLYGTAATVYSAAGSTLCIQAMLALMKQEGRHVLAVRNVHRAFLNAAALLDIDVEWIMPEYCGGLLSGRVSASVVERQLLQCEGKACVYVTSPDYTGRIADIRALAEVCHSHGARLLVDNAHGAHLAFMEENIHPTALGADLCCDSAHKMLPALTGAAMLHSTREEYSSERMKQVMSLFASTSPSYLIMASLDLCNDYMDRRIKSDISESIACLKALREALPEDFILAESEPFHVTIDAAGSGLCGKELAAYLRERAVECEYADNDIVVLLMSPMNTTEDFGALTQSLAAAYACCKKAAPRKDSFVLPLPPKAMTIREAVFSPSETIPVEEALGRVCGAVKVPCPPAVPIAASGEIITTECINIFKRYGISEVNVV